MIATHTSTCNWCEGNGTMWDETECFNCEGIGEVILSAEDCRCFNCEEELEK